MTLTIARRLQLLVLASALGILGLSLLAWRQLDQVYELTNFGNVNTVPSLTTLGEAADGVGLLRAAVWQTLATADESARGTAEQRAAAQAKQVEDSLTRYERENMDEPPEVYAPDKKLLDADRATLARVLALKDQAIAMAREGRGAEAQALLLANEATLGEMSAAFKAHIAFNTDQGRAAAAKAAQSKQRTLLIALAVGLATLGAVGALGWFTLGAIVPPLLQAVDAADRAAAGDLSRRLDHRRDDEVGRLLAALARMQASLSRSVGTVRRNAESVATATAQIAQGNQDLSARTEEQASSLQQTASAMEQLGATVRHNADSAQQANQLARGAAGVAQRGGAAVREVVETMQGIHDSSRRIADIIAVIDGIAFQTNILALNAAVEAARAGEQGRGFAVVAGEVRSLAQRSAGAAREIKQLITDSVVRIEAGGQLVESAGQTMQEIVASIQRVSDIVAEISVAAGEQSRGIDQVGDAVGQMDQTTQQNAALVEQTSAAADSLAGQAKALVDAVAVFRCQAEV